MKPLLYRTWNECMQFCIKIIHACTYDTRIQRNVGHLHVKFLPVLTDPNFDPDFTKIV